MFVFVFGNRQQLKEQIVHHSEWTYQNTDTPLLRSETVIGVDAEGSSGEGDQDQLEANDNDNDDQKDLVVSDSFENV